MRDVTQQLQDYWSEITSDLPEPSLEAARQERVGDGAVRPLQERRPALRRPVWVSTLAALAGVVLIGGAMWSLDGERGSARHTGDGTDSPPSTAVPTTTAEAVVTIVPSEWDPILAGTRAREAPPPAACPPGTDPDRSGPADQQRPDTVPFAGLAAAFDGHAGRIVYVDAAGTTWTFDVCTSTWEEMNPAGTPYESEGDLFDAAGVASGALGDLVYDVDSDRTVAFGHDAVYIYDANTNTWTADSHPSDAVWSFFGAVYDPVSGLVITTTMDDGDRWAVWAYDVDTGTRTPVGTIALDRTTPCCTQIDLLGYSPQLDRLILTTSRESPDESPLVRGLEQVTLLLDPRTGTMELLPIPSPSVNLGWPARSYGQAGGTVFVNGWPDSDRRKWRICGLDVEALEWSMCFEGPRGPDGRIYHGFAAMADDSLNERLVLINGRYGDFWRGTEAAVWAIDLSSGGLVTLVAPPDGP